MITADPVSDSGGSLQRKLTGGGGLQPRHTGGGNYLPPRQSGGGKPPLIPPHQKRISRQSATLGCSSEDNKENKENEVKLTLHVIVAHDDD